MRHARPSMSTFCCRPPPFPFLSAISPSVSSEPAHGAQWRALFLKRHKQQRSSQTLFILPPSPFSFCLHFLVFLSPLPLSFSPFSPLRCSCCAEYSVASPLMLVLWSGTSEYSINLRWARRLRLWQLRVSCCSCARACCMASGWCVLLATDSASFFPPLPCCRVTKIHVVCSKWQTSIFLYFSVLHFSAVHLLCSALISTG